jgi:hypothetical protein
MLWVFPLQEWFSLLGEFAQVSWFPVQKWEASLNCSDEHLLLSPAFTIDRHPSYLYSSPWHYLRRCWPCQSGSSRGHRLCCLWEPGHVWVIVEPVTSSLTWHTLGSHAGCGGHSGLTLKTSPEDRCTRWVTNCGHKSLYSFVSPEIKWTLVWQCVPKMTVWQYL